MAVRQEELSQERAVVYAFPTERAHRRAASARRQDRLRRTTLVVVALVAAIGLLFTGGSAPASRQDAPRRITVETGQTLWELAESYAPDGMDPRAYVDAIVQVNGLDGPPLAGQRIRLPD